MKKFISIMISIVIMISSFPITTFASEKADVADEYNNLVQEYDSKKVFIDGIELTENSKEISVDNSVLQCNEEVVNVNGTIMVSIDTLCDYISATYEPADERSGYSRIECEDTTIWFSELSTAINKTVNNEDEITVLDEAPYIQNDSVMVPLEDFAEVLNYEITESHDDGEHYLLTQPYQTARLLVETENDNIDYVGAVDSIRDEENNITILQFDTQEDAINAEKELNKFKGIINIEPDGIMSSCMFEGYNQSSGELDTIAGHRDENSSECVHIDDMLDCLDVNNLNNITVGVIDTGVCSTHEALKDKVICTDADFSSDAGTSSEDNNGHGTHVSGIIADNTLNNVKILAVKCLNYEGSGTDYQIYQAMKYAVENGAKVLNMSLGRYGKSELMTKYVQELWKENISVVVAAGNSNWFADQFTPAGIPECITVGACDNNATLLSANEFSNGGYPTDIFAPGINIYSTWIYNSKNTGYKVCSGTSMSSPLVAAAVVMLSSYDKDYTAEYIHERIREKSMPWCGNHYPIVNSRGWTYGILDCRNLIDFNRTAEPQVSLFADYLTEKQYNILTCDDENAEIYYTTDGSRVTKDNGILYTEPIYVDSSMRLHIMAISDGKEQSYQEYYDYIYVVTPNDNEFHINDEGTITSFEYKKGVDKFLRIPETINGITVTGLGPNLFDGNSDIIAIFVPETCKVICDYAFRKCTSLKKLNAKGASIIGKQALYDASNINELMLGELEKIGKYSFYFAHGFSNVSSDKLTEIPDYAFYGSSLKELDLPNVTKIGEGAFSDIFGLSFRTVSLPKVEELGEGAFQYTWLRQIDLPSITDADKIGKNAFAGSELTSIDMPNLSGQLKRGIFKNCDNLRTVNLPMVTSVAIDVFVDSNNIKELVMDNVVEFYSDIGGIVSKENSLGTTYGRIEKISMPKCEKFLGRIKSHYLRVLDLPKCKTLYEVDSESIKYLYLPSLENSKTYQFAFKCPNLVYAYLPNFKDIGERNISSGFNTIFLDCYNLEEIDLPSLDFDFSVKGGKQKLIFDLTKKENADKCKLKRVNVQNYKDKLNLRYYINYKKVNFEIVSNLPEYQNYRYLQIDANGYNLSYQWYYSNNGVDFEEIYGANNTYFLPSDEGYYYVEITTNNYTSTSTISSNVCHYTQEPVVNSMAKLSITAPSEFTVYMNGDVFKPKYSLTGYVIDADVIKGTEVSIAYTDEIFEAWIDTNKRVISSNAEFSFTMSEDKTIRCIEKTNGTVSFYNANGDFITSSKCSSFSDNDLPTAPKLYGHTFIGWDKTVEEINNAVKSGESISVYAKYNKDYVYYNLILNGGKVVDTNSDDYNGENSFREFSTVTIKALYNTPTFKYWVDSEGNIVSYRKEYSFFVSQDLELTAIYGNEPVIKEPLIRITNAVIDKDNSRITFIAERDIPDEYTVLEHGILLTQDNLVLSGQEQLTLNYKGKVNKGTSITKGNVGTYTVYKTVNGVGSTVGAVAYVTYLTPSGEVKNEYSNLHIKQFK